MNRVRFMNLLVEKAENNVKVIKPIASGEKNITNIIARTKMIILEEPNSFIVLDLTSVNFLDCIKIGTIIGTYHFLEFSNKKIRILVSNIEIKKALESLSFNNIEIYCNVPEAHPAGALAGIA